MSLQGSAAGDDVSVLVVDFLPASAPDWPAAAAAARRAHPSSGAPSWLPRLGCLGAPAVRDASQRALAPVAGLVVLGDADTWREHVARGEAATRRNLTRDDSAMQTLGGAGGTPKAAAGADAPVAMAQPVA